MKRTIHHYEKLIRRLAKTHTRKQICEALNYRFSQTHLNRFCRQKGIEPVPEPIKPPVPTNKIRPWLECIESMLGAMSCDSYEILTGAWV